VRSAVDPAGSRLGRANPPHDSGSVPDPRRSGGTPEIVPRCRGWDAEAKSMADPALPLQVLGGLRPLDRGTRIAVPSQRVQARLRHLALHEGIPQPRSHLASRFWPDATRSGARAARGGLGARGAGNAGAVARRDPHHRAAGKAPPDRVGQLRASRRGMWRSGHEAARRVRSDTAPGHQPARPQGAWTAPCAAPPRDSGSLGHAGSAGDPRGDVPRWPRGTPRSSSSRSRSHMGRRTCSRIHRWSPAPPQTCIQAAPWRVPASCSRPRCRGIR
jgi:hypothetical protein